MADKNDPAPGQAQAASGATDQAAPAAVAVPAPETTAAAPAEALDFTATMDAITEAKLTGDTKTAARLQAEVDEAKKATPAAKAAPAPKAAPVEETSEEGDDTGGDSADETDANSAEDESAEVTDAGDEPPPGTEAEPAATDKTPERVRINHLSEPDKAKQIAINALTKGGMSLAEASERVLGVGKTSAPADTHEAATHEAEPEAPAATAEITALEAKVKDLKTRLRAAGTGEGLYNEEIADMSSELSEAHAELAARRVAAEQNAANQSREEAVFKAGRTQSTKAAVGNYPDMANKESEQFQLARDMALAAMSESHPDHERSWDVGAPEYFAAKAAKVLKIAPKGKVAAAAIPGKPALKPAPAPVQQTPPPATRPASGAKGSAAAPPAKTRAQIEEETNAVLEGRAKATPRPSVMKNGVLMR